MFDFEFAYDLFAQERGTAVRMTDFINPEVYGPLHFKYMFMGLAMWMIVPFIGKKFMN